MRRFKSDVEFSLSITYGLILDKTESSSLGSVVLARFVPCFVFSCLVYDLTVDVRKLIIM